ncbi:MAG: YqiA/YcfP family alpha/beta fold hydrolase [Betaproteobacteria bacterium]
MTRATLIYLHGFNSSPQTVKGRKIVAAAAALGIPPRVYVPTLHHRPAVAMRDVCAWVDANCMDHAALSFVGSSLGGYYANWLAEKYGARAIVINPAVRPAITLLAHAGQQRNLHTGENWELTPDHFSELEALSVVRLTRMERYFLLMRSGDELLDWRAAVSRYAGAWQCVVGGGNHGWEDIDGEIPSMLRFAGA